MQLSTRQVEQKSWTVSVICSPARTSERSARCRRLHEGLVSMARPPDLAEAACLLVTRGSCNGVNGGHSAAYSEQEARVPAQEVSEVATVI